MGIENNSGIPVNDEKRVVSFVYGGFGVRAGLHGEVDEHQLLRDPTPRFNGHYLHKYVLPDVDSRGLVFDGKFTTDTGWDDRDPEVLDRYAKVAKYAGINTLSFIVYGGVSKEGKLDTFMEETMKNFPLLKDDFPDMHYAPMICAALPRLSLPVAVPIEGKEDYRFEYISPESLKAIVRHTLETYYSVDSERFFSIDGRPVMFLFDNVRIAMSRRFGFDPDILNRTLAQICEESFKEYGKEPYFVGIVNNEQQAAQAQEIDVDALSNYIDLPYFDRANKWPIQSFDDVTKKRKREWSAISSTESSKPFVPALVSGFDATSRVTSIGKGKTLRIKRYNQGSWYPLIPVVPNEPTRPRDYNRYLEAGLDYTTQTDAPFINVGPLNEMTEQCAVLPTYSDNPEMPNTDILYTIRGRIKHFKSSPNN